MNLDTDKGQLTDIEHINVVTKTSFHKEYTGSFAERMTSPGECIDYIQYDKLKTNLPINMTFKHIATLTLSATLLPSSTGAFGLFKDLIKSLSISHQVKNSCNRWTITEISKPVQILFLQKRRTH